MSGEAWAAVGVFAAGWLLHVAATVGYLKARDKYVDDMLDGLAARVLTLEKAERLVSRAEYEARMSDLLARIAEVAREVLRRRRE